MNYRKPAPKAARPRRSTILIALTLALIGILGSLGYQSFRASPSSATDEGRPELVPGTPDGVPGQEGDSPRRRPPRDLPPIETLRGDQQDQLHEEAGIVPDGVTVTVFDDGIPAVANLDPALLDALRRAATDAAGDGVAFSVTSGWRSPEYQDHLLREAVALYGSAEEAARWVATPDASVHVSGGAVDLGPADATAWLSDYGAAYGLCQIYSNEPWHFELRPDAVDDGCPSMYADPTHDPRMQP